MNSFLDDKEWRDLLRDIHARQVIPIVGPELVSIMDESTNERVPLQRYLAPRLAKALSLDTPDSFTTTNDVACAFLMQGNSRKAIYDEIRELMDQLEECPANEALLKLASVTDFDCFISGTFDRQLSKAIQTTRPDFDRSSCLSYHPSNPIDIPEQPVGPIVLNVMGDFNTYPDFAVWDEDYMEFICGLIEHSDTLERLFRLLKNRYLLLLGAPSSDWIVRFFLRVARQKRLSERRDGVAEYLADQSGRLGEPLVFFFDKMIQATRVIDGDPNAFAIGLADRWQEKFGTSKNNDEFLTRMPNEIAKDSVFISYAREDQAQAIKLATALHSAGVPVWIDKARIHSGDNFENVLEAAVLVHCSFFVSIISGHTETDQMRYVHIERGWAAKRHVDGFVFYLPIVIDPQVGDPQHEPGCFKQIHYDQMNSDVPIDFIRRIQALFDEYRRSGRPRG
ncbi:MAG: toll/interleukin-1 receptor domain-containing protein [Planctomycetota bacterium]